VGGNIVTILNGLTGRPSEPRLAGEVCSAPQSPRGMRTREPNNCATHFVDTWVYSIVKSCGRITNQSDNEYKISICTLILPSHVVFKRENNNKMTFNTCVHFQCLHLWFSTEHIK